MTWRIVKVEEGPSLGLRVTFVDDDDPTHEFTGYFTKWAVQDRKPEKPSDA
jgi:hypothetical protein